MEYVLGIDIGTGSCKAIALDKNGEIICTKQEHYSILKSSRHFSEQDPAGIWEAFTRVIKKSVKETESKPLCIALSSVMHSLLVVNRDHHPITNLITWADNRAESEAAELRQAEFAPSLYATSGTPIHSMTPLSKILWLKKHQPETFANALKFLSIKDFIWFKLFGEYQTEESLATGTGLFNISSRHWNPFALELAGIEKDQLPELVKTTYYRNDLTDEVASSFGLDGTTKCCIGGTDGCLANLGSAVTDQATAAVTIGTSGAVRVTSPTPIVDFESMIFNYILDENTFVSGGPVNNGGNVLQWLAKNFLDVKIENDYEEIFKEIEAIPAGAGGLLFLPYLHGERAPVWDERSSGTFVGLRSFHTKAHMLRAAIEGVCFNLKIILENLERFSGEIRQLNASGGFTKEDSWVQMLADITGKKILLTNSEDASAIGAAILGCRAVGLSWRLQNGSDDKFIMPSEINAQVYMKTFELFSALYQPLVPVMHKLSLYNFPA